MNDKERIIRVKEAIINNKLGYERGFKAGQKAKEQEVLKIINEFVKKLEFMQEDEDRKLNRFYNTTPLYNKDFEELKQKVKSK